MQPTNQLLHLLLKDRHACFQYFSCTCCLLIFIRGWERNNICNFLFAIANRELRDETGRLRKSIGEKEYEIKRLSRKIEKTEEEKKIITSILTYAYKDKNGSIYQLK